MGKKKKDKNRGRCSGHCCRAFTIGGRSYEELKVEYQMWLRGERDGTSVMRGTMRTGRPEYGLGHSRRVNSDIHVVFPMLIPLGKLTANPFKLINETPVPDDYEGQEFYSCKHFIDGDCSIYDVRPTMCQSYGTHKNCEFADCTWEGHQEAKRPTHDELVEMGGLRKADYGDEMVEKALVEGPNDLVDALVASRRKG